MPSSGRVAVLVVFDPPMPHHEVVSMEEPRDRKTLAIGTALAIFVCVLVIGALVLWLAGAVGLGDGISRSDELPLFAVSGLLMVVYLARAR
jgi:hypothetical protein